MGTSTNIPEHISDFLEIPENEEILSNYIKLKKIYEKIFQPNLEETFEAVFNRTFSEATLIEEKERIKKFTEIKSSFKRNRARALKGVLTEVPKLAELDLEALKEFHQKTKSDFLRFFSNLLIKKTDALIEENSVLGTDTDDIEELIKNESEVLKNKFIESVTNWANSDTEKTAFHFLHPLINTKGDSALFKKNIYNDFFVLVHQILQSEKHLTENKTAFLKKPVMLMRLYKGDRNSSEPLLEEYDAENKQLSMEEILYDGIETQPYNVGDFEYKNILKSDKSYTELLLLGEGIESSVEKIKSKLPKGPEPRENIVTRSLAKKAIEHLNWEDEKIYLIALNKIMGNTIGSNRGVFTLSEITEEYFSRFPDKEANKFSKLQQSNFVLEKLFKLLLFHQAISKKSGDEEIHIALIQFFVDVEISKKDGDIYFSTRIPDIIYKELVSKHVIELNSEKLSKLSNGLAWEIATQLEYERLELRNYMKSNIGSKRIVEFKYHYKFGKNNKMKDVIQKISTALQELVDNGIVIKSFKYLYDKQIFEYEFLEFTEKELLRLKNTRIDTESDKGFLIEYSAQN